MGSLFAAAAEQIHTACAYHEAAEGYRATYLQWRDLCLIRSALLAIGLDPRDEPGCHIVPRDAFVPAE